jgi:hypothetical protein
MVERWLEVRRGQKHSLLRYVQRQPATIHQKESPHLLRDEMWASQFAVPPCFLGHYGEALIPT